MSEKTTGGRGSSCPPPPKKKVEVSQSVLNIKNSMKFSVIIENLMRRIKNIHREYLKDIKNLTW